MKSKNILNQILDDFKIKIYIIEPAYGNFKFWIN